MINIASRSSLIHINSFLPSDSIGLDRCRFRSQSCAAVSLVVDLVGSVNDPGKRTANARERMVAFRCRQRQFHAEIRSPAARVRKEQLSWGIVAAVSRSRIWGPDPSAWVVVCVAECADEVARHAYSIEALSGRGKAPPGAPDRNDDGRVLAHDARSRPRDRRRREAGRASAIPAISPIRPTRAPR